MSLPRAATMLFHVGFGFIGSLWSSEFCRCSSGVAPHPLKILVSHPFPPPFPGGVAPKFVALHEGVASTVAGVALHCATKVQNPLPQKLLNSDVESFVMESLRLSSGLES